MNIIALIVSVFAVVNIYNLLHCFCPFNSSVLKNVPEFFKQIDQKSGCATRRGGSVNKEQISKSNIPKTTINFEKQQKFLSSGKRFLSSLQICFFVLALWKITKKIALWKKRKACYSIKRLRQRVKYFGRNTRKKLYEKHLKTYGCFSSGKSNENFDCFHWSVLISVVLLSL